jgi:hypothetical protein
MDFLAEYLRDMSRIHGSGEANIETSYYPALASLLNRVGASLSPAVHCVLTPKNRGSGIPDGAIFLQRSVDALDNAEDAGGHAPERGGIELKGLKADVRKVARGAQVRRYLDRYGQVLVTNYREFLQVRSAADGTPTYGEAFCLADSDGGFWKLAYKPDADLATPFADYLRRVLLADAPLTSPQDL